MKKTFDSQFIKCICDADFTNKFQHFVDYRKTPIGDLIARYENVKKYEKPPIENRPHGIIITENFKRNY